MYEIEPFPFWREYYIAANDSLSPFYRRTYSEFEFSHRIYNYYIHPQWDFFGSSTLYCKLIFCDYETGFAIIEFLGEWNDALHNDIMELKRGLIDDLISNGISKFLLIGENVLNFHASDELYYEEWKEEIAEANGWIVGVNFRKHVVDEMRSTNIHHYIDMGDYYDNMEWRKHKPNHLLLFLNDFVMRGLEG